MTIFQFFTGVVFLTLFVLELKHTADISALIHSQELLVNHIREHLLLSLEERASELEVPVVTPVANLVYFPLIVFSSIILGFWTCWFTGFFDCWDFSQVPQTVEILDYIKHNAQATQESCRKSFEIVLDTLSEKEISRINDHDSLKKSLNSTLMDPTKLQAQVDQLSTNHVFDDYS